MRSRMLAAALVLGWAAAAASCSGAEPTGPADVPGEYALVSVNGNPLPTVVLWPGGPRTYISGSLSLQADGRFMQVAVIESCLSGTCITAPDTTRGAWTSQGRSLFFAGDHGVATPPPLVIGDGRRVTFCLGAADEPCAPELVYEKR